jgi:hypothetical protein
LAHLYQKTARAKMAGCVAQAVELLTSKAEALNSNPVPSKNKGRGENKQVEKEAI